MLAAFRAQLVGAIVLASVSGAAAEDDPESWQEEALAHFEFDTTVGLSVGFDSNPTGDADGAGSPFTRLDLAHVTSVGQDSDTQASLDLEASLIRYLDSERISDHEYSLDFILTHQLNDRFELSAGALHQKDDTDDPPSALSEIWASVDADLDIVRWELRGAIGDDRDFVDDGEIREDDLEDFDNRYATAELRTEIKTGTRYTPVLETRVTSLDYIRQRPGKADRDAVDYSVMAGTEIAITDELRVQIGLRRNERFFEETRFDSYASTGLDLEIEWTPRDDLALEASFEKSLDEPLEEEARVLDVTKAELELRYGITERLLFNAEAAYTREEEIGVDYSSTELEALAELRWKLHDNLALLLGGEAERETDDYGTVDRGIIRAGLEATF